MHRKSLARAMKIYMFFWQEKINIRFQFKHLSFKMKMLFVQLKRNSFLFRFIEKLNERGHSLEFFFETSSWMTNIIFSWLTRRNRLFVLGNQKINLILNKFSMETIVWWFVESRLFFNNLFLYSETKNNDFVNVIERGSHKENFPQATQVRHSRKYRFYKLN